MEQLGSSAPKSLYDVELATSTKSRNPGKQSVLKINDLNPDADGDGKVTGFEKEVHKLFMDADKDGSGDLSLTEFMGVISKVVKMKKEKHQLKKALCLAIIMIVVMVVANTALTVAVTIAFKDTYTAANGVSTTANGQLTRPGGFSVSGTAQSSRARRLVEVNGRTLLSVADIAQSNCNEVLSAAAASGQVSGNAQVASSAGTQVYVGQITNTNGGVVTLANTNGASVEVHNCATVYTPVSRLRKLALEEARTSRRRLAVGMNDDLKSLESGCVVYHCFEGDKDCATPSPRDACAEWADGNNGCLEPLCAYVVA